MCIQGQGHRQMMTGLTLTQFTSRSKVVAYALVWKKVELLMFWKLLLPVNKFVFAINQMS